MFSYIHKSETDGTIDRARDMQIEIGEKLHYAKTLILNQHCTYKAVVRKLKGSEAGFDAVETFGHTLRRLAAERDAFAIKHAKSYILKAEEGETFDEQLVRAHREVEYFRLTPTTKDASIRAKFKIFALHAFEKQIKDSEL